MLPNSQQNMSRLLTVPLAVLILLILVTKLSDLVPALRGSFPAQHVFTSFGFTEQDIPSLTGKTVIVTGANSGIGYGTTLLLARHGADVLMACRSLEKCEIAKKQMGNDVRAKLTCMKLDVSSLEDVKRFAGEFQKSNKPLHSLINNAGIMYPPFQLTKDGFESTWGTNHMGHFLLTHLLLPELKKAQPSTIVSVASNAQFFADGESDISKFNDPTTYNIFTQYGRSKLANVLFANELAPKIAKDGVYINSLNPGGVRGDLYRHLPWGIRQLTEFSQDYLFWSEEQAALTVIGAAFSPRIVKEKITGKYFVPVFRLDGASPAARNATLAKQWYEDSAKVLAAKGFPVSVV